MIEPAPESTTRTIPSLRPISRAGSRAGALGIVSLCALALPAAPTVVGAQRADPDFSTTYDVSAVALAGTTLYVGGFYDRVGPRNAHCAGLNLRRGDPVPGWPRFDGPVYGCVSDGAGGWFVGGQFQQIGRFARSNIAHLRADYSVDSWNPSADVTVYTMVLHESTLYVAGEFTRIGGEARSRIAAVDIATGRARPWNPDANRAVRCLLVRDSLVYAGGDFTTIGGQVRSSVAAIESATGLATAWDPGGTPDGSVFGIAASDTTLYLAGAFYRMGGQPRNNLAAIGALSGLATPWNPNPNKQARALAVSGTTVYVGGDFTSVGGQPRSLLAALDATSGLANAWDPYVSGRSVRALTVRGETVYAAGEFTLVGLQLRYYVAAIDATTGVPTEWAPPASYIVHALAVDDSIALAGGVFVSMGGRVRNNLAAIDVTSGRVTDWNPGRFVGTVNAFAVDSTTLYLGGSFGSLGSSRANLAAVDRVQVPGVNPVRDWNPAPNAMVDALATDGSVVYVAGRFTAIGGQSRTRLVAIDASGHATAWNPAPDGPVLSLAVRGSTVYAAGIFSNIGGQPRRGVAALDATTGLATSWNARLDGGVGALAFGDSTVYVAGGFTAAGGAFRRGLAEIDTISGRVTSWSPYLAAGIQAMQVRKNVIYVGGSTSSTNGVVSSFLEAIDLTSGRSLDWKPTGSGRVRTLAAGSGWVFAGGDFLDLGGEKGGLAALSSPAFALDVAALGSGTVDSSPDLEVYDGGTAVTATAIPAPGWTFLGWAGDAEGSDNPLGFSMIANRAITATFADTTRPEAQVVFPSGGSSVRVDAETTLAWVATDAAGVARVDLVLSRHGNGGPFRTIASGIPNTGSLRWRVTGPPTRDALIEVVAHDASGNAGVARGEGRFAITVGLDALAGAPAAFALALPAPSPTSRVARVSFDVPRRAPVRVTLLDVTGRQVQIVVDETFEPGTHGAALDAGRLPEGLYFLRLQAPGADLRRRLIVLK